MAVSAGASPPGQFHLEQTGDPDRKRGVHLKK